MTVVVVYNPVSGRGRAEPIARDLAAALDRAGVGARLVASRREDPAAWLRPELVGARAAVVVGGDGAVRMVAREAARAAVPLWQFPSGTENLFARSFGMTADAAAVVAAVQEGRVRNIDLGLAGAHGQDAGEHFAIMASIGFDAEVVHALGRSRKGGIRHASYLAPMLESIRNWKPAELAWEIDGEAESLGRGLVVVGNLPEYGVRLNPTPDAVADDRALDAVFIPIESPLAVLGWIPMLRSGLHRHHPGVRFRRGGRVRLVASTPVRLQLDGDPVGDLGGAQTLAFSIASERLPVLLPATSSAR